MLRIPNYFNLYYVKLFWDLKKKKKKRYKSVKSLRSKGHFISFISTVTRLV